MQTSSFYIRLPSPGQSAHKCGGEHRGIRRKANFRLPAGRGTFTGGGDGVGGGLITLSRDKGTIYRYVPIYLNIHINIFKYNFIALFKNVFFANDPLAREHNADLLCTVEMNILNYLMVDDIE